MDRRAFITTVGGGILASPLAVSGQQTEKVYRVGYLTVPSRDTAQGVANSFQLALRDLGWIDGQNVLIDYRFAESNVDRLPDLAAELVRLKADVIVAGANAAVTATKNATSTIPIVMFLAVDPGRLRPGSEPRPPRWKRDGADLDCGDRDLRQAATDPQERVPACLARRRSRERR